MDELLVEDGEDGNWTCRGTAARDLMYELAWFKAVRKSSEGESESAHQSSVRKLRPLSVSSLSVRSRRVVGGACPANLRLVAGATPFFLRLDVSASMLEYKCSDIMFTIPT